MVRAQSGPISEQSKALKARTEAFAVAVVACRTYTDRLFISKIAIVDEEADESEFWFRIIRKAGLKNPESVAALEQEAHELASIFSASLRTTRANFRKRQEATSRKRASS